LRTLRLLLGDQLSPRISSLRGLDQERDVVLMVEVIEEATYVRHHKKKIAFLFSAMRHRADELRRAGVTVDYVRLDDEGNRGSFGREVARAAARHAPDRVVVTEPGEWRVLEAMQRWEVELGLPVEIREDDRFLCSHAEFGAWARNRREFRMEFFYREMRKATGWLMEGGKPVGERWNFDRDNRQALPRAVEAPPPPSFPPDAITAEILDLVARRFSDHFGDLEPFGFAVTRADALRALSAFVDERLAKFGDYQDAMRAGEPFLFHAVLSPYINSGLLDPREVCEAAIAGWEAGKCPLNAVEGFVRQIAGWREYVRGLYWLKMPDYARGNHLAADRPLPAFYWTGETDMNCLANCVRDTRRNAYAHHIQRLMVLGNFALLAGLKPAEVEAWYLVVYADAYDWVELPNVHGMILYADGGLLGSKPYAASGSYIDRMSDYCAGCRYDVRQKLGPEACPFNYLYWDFHIRNEARLACNPRLAYPYRTLAAMPEDRRARIRAEAAAFLDDLVAAY
jgi:deoxyribodipyrimidine photolyase-related protein